VRRVHPLLQRLETEQAQLAKEALAQPQGRDAFEYGRVVGMYAGLEQAVNVLLDLIKEDEERGLRL
jgi:hypothetical protein